jgi:hypothetical protein
LHNIAKSQFETIAHTKSLMNLKMLDKRNKKDKTITSGGASE